MEWVGFASYSQRPVIQRPRRRSRAIGRQVFFFLGANFPFSAGPFPVSFFSSARLSWDVDAVFLRKAPTHPCGSSSVPTRPYPCSMLYVPLVSPALRMQRKLLWAAGSPLELGHWPQPRSIVFNLGARLLPSTLRTYCRSWPSSLFLLCYAPWPPAFPRFFCFAFRYSRPTSFVYRLMEFSHRLLAPLVHSRIFFARTRFSRFFAAPLFVHFLLFACDALPRFPMR